MCSWTGIQTQKPLAQESVEIFAISVHGRFAKYKEKQFLTTAHTSQCPQFISASAGSVYFGWHYRVYVCWLRLELNIKSLSQCLLIWLWKCSQVMYEKSNILHRSVMSVRIVANCGAVVAHLEMWWLIWRCGGSLAPDFWRNVPGSNPASSTMILGRCRIIV